MKSTINQSHVLRCFATVLFVSAVAVNAGLAQSKDRDHPTAIASPEITGFIDKTVAGDHYYYSLIAGPGELTFTFNCEAGRGMNTFAIVNFELFDVNGRSALRDYCNPNDGNTEQKVGRLTLARRQPLVLLIKIDGMATGGKYRARISGPLALAPGGSGSNAGASHGKMHVEMTDGTVQEIDLAQVRRITLEP